MRGLHVHNLITRHKDRRLLPYKHAHVHAVQREYSVKYVNLRIDNELNIQMGPTEVNS